MASVTAASLIANTQLKSDIRTGSFINSAEWLTLVNDGYKALWHAVMGANPDFRITDQAVSITNTATPTQALPSDYLATRVVIRDYGLQSEEILDSMPLRVSRRGLKRSYRIDGTNLVIEPYQLSAGTYTHRYNPECPVMASNGSTDAELGRFSNFIELHAAIAARIIDEDASDSLTLELWGNPGRQQRGVIDDVRDWAKSKRTADPVLVEDVRPRGRRSWNRLYR